MPGHVGQGGRSGDGAHLGGHGLVVVHRVATRLLGHGAADPHGLVGRGGVDEVDGVVGDLPGAHQDDVLAGHGHGGARDVGLAGVALDVPAGEGVARHAGLCLNGEGGAGLVGAHAREGGQDGSRGGHAGGNVAARVNILVGDVIEVGGVVEDEMQGGRDGGIDGARLLVGRIGSGNGHAGVLGVARRQPGHGGSRVGGAVGGRPVGHRGLVPGAVGGILDVVVDGDGQGGADHELGGEGNGGPDGGATGGLGPLDGLDGVIDAGARGGLGQADVGRGRGDLLVHRASGAVVVGIPALEVEVGVRDRLDGGARAGGEGARGGIDGHGVVRGAHGAVGVGLPGDSRLVLLELGHGLEDGASGRRGGQDVGDLAGGTRGGGDVAGDGARAGGRINQLPALEGVAGLGGRAGGQLDGIRGIGVIGGGVGVGEVGGLLVVLDGVATLQVVHLIDHAGTSRHRDGGGSGGREVGVRGNVVVEVVALIGGLGRSVGGEGHRAIARNGVGGGQGTVLGRAVQVDEDVLPLVGGLLGPLGRQGHDGVGSQALGVALHEVVHGRAAMAGNGGAVHGLHAGARGGTALEGDLPAVEVPAGAGGNVARGVVVVVA